MVRLIKKEIPEQKIESLINKAKNLYSSIEKEISELKEPQFIKNSSSNLPLTLNQSSSLNLGENYNTKQRFYIQDTPQNGNFNKTDQNQINNH